MFQPSRLLPTLLLAAGVTLVGSGTANADHLVQGATMDKHGNCTIGEIASGLGIGVDDGRVLNTKSTDGVLTSYTCQFKNFPTFVADGDNDLLEEDFVLPKKGLTITGVPCSTTGDDGLYGEATIRVKGNGHAKVTCLLSPGY